MSLESKVVRDLPFFGSCIQLQYGCTQIGQRFATLITHAVLYAVRVYMDEDHSELPPAWIHWLQPSAIFKTDHTTLEGAQSLVAMYHRQLNSGDYSAFLTHLPPHSVYAFVPQAKTIKTTPFDCATNPDFYLLRGDIVQTNFLLVANHEGIYIGNGKVIHVSGHGEGKTAAVAREGRLLGDFVSSPGDPIRVVVPRVRFRTLEETAKQAEDYRDQRFREGEYNLFVQNCQHFAALCAFGFKVL